MEEVRVNTEKQPWWEVPAAMILFVYEFVHESLGWIGMLIVGFLVFEGILKTGSEFLQLGSDIWAFVQDVFTKPFDVRTALAGGTLLLSFLIAWYKTGVIVVKMRELRKRYAHSQ